MDGRLDRTECEDGEELCDLCRTRVQALLDSTATEATEEQGATEEQEAIIEDGRFIVQADI